MNYKTKAALISIICAILMIGLFVGIIFGVKYFIDHFDKITLIEKQRGIEIKINDSTENLYDLEDYLKTNSAISSKSINVKEKIIYITFNVKEDINEKAAKKVAENTINYISSNTLDKFDISYVITSNNINDINFPIIGYKSTSNDYISWQKGVLYD